jgi:DNA invertase Pin-like site-specific DNA recombinase
MTFRHHRPCRCRCREKENRHAKQKAENFSAASTDSAHFIQHPPSTDKRVNLNFEPRAIADLPMIEGATGRFMQACVAEFEANLISARTKAALAEAKKRGVVLGGYDGRDFTAKDVKASIAVRQEQAAQRAADLCAGHQRATGGRRYIIASHCGRRR